MTTELDLDDVAAQSEKAKRELAELRRDAARYRWLRQAEWIDDAILSSIDCKDGDYAGLDAAIDAAMTAQSA